MKTIAIIGGGPAGYTAAEYAASNGLKVILFEEKKLGGVCLNEGCIPTKTLLYSAKMVANAQNSKKYGINIEDISIDIKKIIARKNKVVRKLNAGIRAKLNHPHITTIGERATLQNHSNSSIEIQTATNSYTADYLLNCTGSHNIIPPIDGVANKQIWSSTEALDPSTLPSTLAIIGGGVIGIEFADLYNALGVKVTVIERMDEILGKMDKQISQSLREALTRKGITFHLSSQVRKIGQQNSITLEKENKTETLETEQILIAVGRKANTQQLELERLGITLHPNGGIGVNEYMQTNLPHIYAAGDVTGQSMLAHTASREAEVAINHILGIEDRMTYHAIPSVVYTTPEVASVGETEQTLIEKNVPYKSQQLPMSYSGRFVAENEGQNGLCNILSCPTTGKILGIQLLGNPASEIITTATLAIEQKLTVERWKKSVFPHPTVSEILKETLFTSDNNN